MAPKCLLNIYVYTHKQVFQHLASIEEVALRKELGECRDWWLPRVLKLSDSRVLSSRQNTRWPPLRLRDHCGTGGRNNLRVGSQREGLRSAVFRERRSPLRWSRSSCSCLHNHSSHYHRSGRNSEDHTPPWLPICWCWILRERGSHCLHLRTHRWAHQAPVNGLKLRVTQMALVKFRGPQDKTKEHGCGRQVGAGLPGSGESYEKEQVGVSRLHYVQVLNCWMRKLIKVK